MVITLFAIEGLCKLPVERATEAILEYQQTLQKLAEIDPSTTNNLPDTSALYKSIEIRQKYNDAESLQSRCHARVHAMFQLEYLQSNLDALIPEVIAHPQTALHVIEGKTQKEIDRMEVVFEKMRAICLGRSFFVTRLGRLGLGFRSIHEHDQIWLLAGSRLPCVLRPLLASTSFKFLGQAYVHGMMFEELCPENRHKLREVVLQ